MNTDVVRRRRLVPWYISRHHADREHVIDTLKAAFVQGRLAKGEMDVRVGQVLASRTYADLAALTADNPTALPTAQPLRKPGRAQARPPAATAIMWVAAGLIPPASLVSGLPVLFPWKVTGLLPGSSWPWSPFT